jgi:hypothetical protein
MTIFLNFSFLNCRYLWHLRCAVWYIHYSGALIKGSCLELSSVGSMNNATFMYDGNAAMSESTANYQAKHSSQEL